MWSARLSDGNSKPVMCFPYGLCSVFRPLPVWQSATSGDDRPSGMVANLGGHMNMSIFLGGESAS